MVYARIRPGFKRTAKRLIRDAEMETWETAVHYGHPLLSAIGWKGALPECRCSRHLPLHTGIETGDAETAIGKL
jgi:hypothetical protein